MIPVPDLALFLAGPWRIARRIADRRLGTTGRLTGVARFTPEAGGLRYVESGLLVFGGFSGPASRTLWFAFERNGVADVRFADGRPFHRVDLSSGVAHVVHHCAPDRYRGRYKVRDRDRWQLTWFVEGPRKQICMGTRFIRSVAAGPEESITLAVQAIR
ncbi:MAG: hypothetical protein JOZ58_02335 [Acetobacteraceae bacterium]|nr:hypothetical protein [Acetobacteraceae bacterium]